MRRKITLITSLFLIIMLSFSMIQPTYAASSKKPAAPKITSATANGTTIAISWSKAKNAKKYEIAQRFDGKSWVKYKTVKKTKKNKKKYTKANKYKVKAKGKKYIVYKYDYYYGTEKIVSKKTRSVKFKNLNGNTFYTFAVRSVNGKKHSAWKKVTIKTGPKSVRMVVNGKPVVVTQGKKITLPSPTFRVVSTNKIISINKKAFDIIPGNGEDDFYESEGNIVIRGKDPSGFDAHYSYFPDNHFSWGREQPSLFDNREKYGYVSYGSEYMSWPEELIISINNSNMKAVWTLDGKEPQINQTDEYISAEDYPFGAWTNGNRIRIHGTTTESYNVPEARWANASGYRAKKSAPMVMWVKLYNKTTVVQEEIIIDMD